MSWGNMSVAGVTSLMFETEEFACIPAELDVAGEMEMCSSLIPVRSPSRLGVDPDELTRDCIADSSVSILPSSCAIRRSDSSARWSTRLRIESVGWHFFFRRWHL
jgi:hypothetical protein